MYRSACIPLYLYQDFHRSFYSFLRWLKLTDIRGPATRTFKKDIIVTGFMGYRQTTVELIRSRESLSWFLALLLSAVDEKQQLGISIDRQRRMGTRSVVTKLGLASRGFGRSNNPYRRDSRSFSRDRMTASPPLHINLFFQYFACSFARQEGRISFAGCNQYL